MTVKNILGRLPKRCMKHGLAFFFAFVAVGVHAVSTWYVDAIGGNDANDGKTTATAVKTLKAAMEIPLLADGDTVVAGPMLNTLIIQSSALSENIHGTNCVTTTSFGENFVSSLKSVKGSPTFMMAPAIGDYRAIAGQEGVGLGDVAFIEQIPQEFRFTDFNGDTVVAEDGKVTVGACTVPVEPVGGHLVFDKTDYVVNSKGISFAWTRIHSDRADARVKISATRSMWLNIMPVRTNFSTLEPFWVKVW